MVTKASAFSVVKNYMIAWTIVSGILIGGWLTLILLNSPCDNPALQANFDVKRYTGTWYELQRSQLIPFESGECVTARYTAQPDGSIEVKNTQLIGDQPKDIVGRAYASTFTPGSLEVIFYAELGANYRVVSTDYDSYAVVYSCTTILGNSLTIFKYAWVLARQPLVQGSAAYKDLMRKVQPVITGLLPNFDIRWLRTTQQGGNCIYSN